MKLAVFRDKKDIEFEVEFELNGGICQTTSISVVLGKTYKDLPMATKQDYVLDGWYEDPSFTRKVANDSLVDFSVRKLYAKWVEMTNYTSFQITTTSSHKTAGFSSITKKSTSECFFIDWGDGTVERFDSDVSSKEHQYSDVGTYVVKISDGISSLTVQGSSSTDYGRNRYTLEKVLTWSTSLTTLPNYCFYYASSMTAIEADLSGMTSLGSYCFYYCNTLSSFEFMRNMTKITSIPSYCFYQCTYFNNLDVIPTSVTSFGPYAFYQCRITDLSRIRSTDTLNSYCFAYNTTLTSLATLKPRTSFPAYLFYYCSGLKQADLSQFTSLTSLNTYCFYYCSQLTSVSLPDSMKMISDYTFRYCSSLKNIDFISNKTQLTSIGSYSFANCTALSSINLPSTMKSIGTYAFYYDYASDLKDLNLSGLTSLTSIGSYAFQYCYNLTSISLPSSLTSIGDYAFAGCYNVSQISSYRDSAPTTYANTFGSSTTNGTTAYVGNNKKSTNSSRLYANIPANYKTSYWNSVLLDSSKCNFKVISFDQYSAQGFEIEGVKERYVYTGSAVIPYFTVKNSNGNILTKGLDYNFSIANNVETGTAIITVTGIGSYHDSIQMDFEIFEASSAILDVDLNSQWRIPEKWTNANSNFDVYESHSNYNVSNGYSKMYINVDGLTSLTIYINSYAESNYDYTLAFIPGYDPTSLPSGSSVTGNVAGTTYGYQYNPSSYEITSGTGWKPVTYSLNGSSNRICICFRKDGSVNSNWDRGYVAIPSNVAIDTSFMLNLENGRIIKLLSESSTYPSQLQELANSIVVLNSENRVLAYGVDYSISFGDVVNDVADIIVTGKSPFTGRLAVQLKIAISGTNINEATISAIDDVYNYTGEEITPIPVLTINGIKLVQGIDFIIEYENNVESGIAICRIIGINDYYGTIDKEFEIFKAGQTRISLKVGSESPENAFGFYQLTKTPTAQSININWGDGSSEDIAGNVSNKSHTYSTPGNYIVNVDNSINSIVGTSTQDFYDKNKQITSIKFGDDVLTVGSYAFYHSENLKEIDLSNCNVTTVEKYAFRYAKQVSAIYIGDSVQDIGNYAFHTSSYIQDVQVSENNQYLEENNGFLIKKTTKQIIASDRFGQEIPSTASALLYYSMAYNPMLTSIVVPNTISSIGIYALAYNPNLLCIEYDSSSTTIGRSPLISCSNLQYVKVKTPVTAYGTISNKCQKMKVVDFSERSVQTIPTITTSTAAAGPFYGCENQISIIVPDDLYSSWLTSSNWPTWINNGTIMIVKSSEFTGIELERHDYFQVTLDECPELGIIDMLKTTSDKYEMTKFFDWTSHKYTTNFNTCGDPEFDFIQYDSTTGKWKYIVYYGKMTDQGYGEYITKYLDQEQLFSGQKMTFKQTAIDGQEYTFNITYIE